jgi:hypothetical protein
MTMINETVLPNPFKAQGSHLDHVLAAVERELEQYNEPLPAFLDRRFLERLHGSVERADPAHHSRGRRIVNLLKMHLSREP